MTTTLTYDVYSTLDGYGSYAPPADWGGYWGKQGPEFLAHRLDNLAADQRMVFGATTFRAFAAMLADGTEHSGVLDPWVDRMRNLPTTVVSSTLDGTLGWPDATIASGDAVEVIRRLKETSPVPLRSHGSVGLNRDLMAAGLVDRIQVSLFPVISGRTGVDPVFAGAADFDLELLDRETFDGDIQVLTYAPTLRTWGG